MAGRICFTWVSRGDEELTKYSSTNYDQKKTEEESFINRDSTLVQKYRHFLIRHAASLGLFERLMENFEYYIPFRYDTRRKVDTIIHILYIITPHII